MIKVTHWRPTGGIFVVRNSRGTQGPPSQPDVYENTPEISNMMTMMAMRILAFVLFAKYIMRYRKNPLRCTALKMIWLLSKLTRF